jgi:polysaccharide export outer membrane protein
MLLANLKKYVFLIIALSLVSCGSELSSAITPIMIKEYEKPLPFELPESLKGQQSYEIRAGDKLIIEIEGQKDTRFTVAVRPDGYISYKYIGDVKASGESFNSLKNKIEFKLKDYYNDPKITLIGEAFKGHTFTIMGEAINKPGRYVLEQETRVLDALAMAGGLKLARRNENDVTIANLKKAKLIRDNKELPVNLHALYFDQVWNLNVALRAGDTLVIPSNINSTVILLGEIKSPKAYGYSPKMTVSQLVANAGYFTDNSDKKNILLTRRSDGKPKVYRVDFTKIERGLAADVDLEPGDIIYIPKTFFAEMDIVVGRLSRYSSAIISVDDAVKLLEN